MKNKYSLVNDQLLPAEQASVLITDLGIQRGYGVFDFFKTQNGKPVFLEDHLDRLFNSLSALRLPFAYTRENLHSMLQELMSANGIANSGVRITVTGGYSPDGFSIADSANMIVTQQQLSVNNPPAGIRLITHNHQRQLPHVKSLDYMMAIWLQPRIAEKNAQDVLYCPDGIVTECPRANFFIVTEHGDVLTPAENILKGIIRKQVLKLAGQFSIKEGQISLADTYKAKECFITSTTKNILPVVQINDQVIGDGKPGRITQKLSASINEMISEHLETSTVHHA